jgi:hypothetical protein
MKECKSIDRMNKEKTGLAKMGKSSALFERQARKVRALFETVLKLRISMVTTDAGTKIDLSDVQDEKAN